MATKNVFVNMGDDSDGEADALKQKMTKTQKKKEERKIGGGRPQTAAAGGNEEAAFFAKTGVAQGGFQADFTVSDKKARAPREGPRDGPARGGRGGGDRGRGGRGGNNRGNRGGPGRGGPRPGTARRMDADGNPVHQNQRRDDRPFRGKPREDGHPMDRQDGTGKALRGNKKGGHGKANWGDRDDKVYKKKGEEQATEEKKVEEPVEEKKEKEPEYVEEVIGYSLDDFLADKTFGAKKEARAAQGVKDKNTKANAEVKEKQSTVLQAQAAKSTAYQAGGNTEKVHLGFTAADDEPVAGRGGRGGRNQEGGQRGGRRQNARAALKKTEDEFPTL